MPWAPVDHGFSSHPKVVALLDRDDDEGMTALGMWALLLPVVRDQADPQHPERAGVVSRSLLRRWAGPRGESLAKLLVEARDDREHGLWEVHPQGWRYHNFIERSGLAEWWAKSAQARRAARARWGPPDTPVDADAYADALRTDMQQDRTGQEKTGQDTNAGDSAAVAVPDRPEIEHLCVLLADLIEGNGAKRPTITKAWRDACRLLLDKDLAGRFPSPVHEVEGAINWSQQDEFWRANVLSMPTLRKQFDRLRLAAQRNGGQRRPSRDQAAAALLHAAAQSRGEQE